MSFEQALIARAQPHIVSEMARAAVLHEAVKGCQPAIAPAPVALEPLYERIQMLGREFGEGRGVTAVQEVPPCPEELVRLRVWISPEETFDCRRTERFLKQLQTVSHRLGLEIQGNQKEVSVELLCHQDDVPVVAAAFRGEFGHHELSVSTEPVFATVPIEQWEDAVILDAWPPPPYSRLLTSFSELKYSPYEPLVSTLATFPPPTIGIYQVLFQPVAPTHNWHHNVEVLQDLEYGAKLLGTTPWRYAQQAPSGDLRHMAMDLESKAHSDKPFYAAAMRVAVLGAGEKGPRLLQALSTFLGLFQYGGRPLNFLTEKDYALHLAGNGFREMFRLGLVYRSGFLLNSWELAGPCHIPPAQIFETRAIPLELLSTLPVAPSSCVGGTRIGTCHYAGQTFPVYIPERIEAQHAHLIGSPGVGKSTTLEEMVLQDIDRGHAVVVLDPHGDMVERLLGLIPENHADRTVYFSLGDPDWVPLLNPLKKEPGQDVGRTADDLVGAFKSFMEGWGDRLGHLLRNTFCGLLTLPDSTLLDATELLIEKTDASARLRRRIVEVVDNEHTRRFWEKDFDRYRSADLTPPQHKLGQLFGSSSVSRMLSQPESKISLRDVLEAGKILLVDLSGLSSETRNVLGSFLLCLVHMAALGRSSIPIDSRKPVSVYCDEAHRFLTDAIEDLLNEGRKFNVRFRLAHHQMSQFVTRKTDAILGVGTTIVFRVDSRDAAILSRGLLGKAATEDLVALADHEAIARIGNEVVRLKTPTPREVPASNFRERIIEESHRKYYRPAHEVREMIRNRNNRWVSHFTALGAGGGPSSPRAECEDLAYDEFP